MDDEAPMLELGKSFLESSGDLHVDTFISVADAENAMLHTKYDAIVSDYQMPVSNGINFLKNLRARGNKIPFILFTGKGREEVVIEALNSGADFYLQKGGNPTAQYVELEHKIKEAVRRSRAERALHENQERLKKAHALGQTGCWEYSPDSPRMIWGSEEGFAIFGMNRHSGEVPVEDIEACIINREVAHQALVDAASIGKKYDLVYEIHPANGGAPRTIHSIAELERDESGTVIKILGLLQDITVQRQAEETLRRSEEKYAKVFQNSAANIILARVSDGHIVDVNETWLENTGYPREDFVGHSTIELGIWKHPEEWDEFIRCLRNYGSVRDWESEIVRKDGRMGVMLMSAQLLTLGGVEMMLGSSTDITERKQAEEALNQSAQLFRGIVDNIPVRVFWKDENLTFLGCNMAFAQDAGYPDPEDVIGKNDFQMIWADQAEIYQKDDRQVIESGAPKLLIRESQRTPDGRIITLLTNKIPLRDKKGEVVGVLGTYMDITEWKNDEHAPIQSDKKVGM
ncbi:MAG: PAS domain S-box protein [Methanomassiliicoccus sp.]|nr:PAS domain S-box protein [Methanomassiliicoccus sp.]